MRIVIAPDSFKDCLPASAVARAMMAGCQRAIPEAVIDLVPMADGGQGTLDTLVEAAKGDLAEREVTGPLGNTVRARWGLIDGGQTAVIEMAQASGLELVPLHERNPMRTTSFGTGQLILAALDAGARRILIGIGGSATNDGGIGMAQALGYAFLDSEGKPLPLGAKGLTSLARIDSSGRDPRLANVTVQVACDVTNPLTGPQGASAVYGPQKGATSEMIAELDRGLGQMGRIIEKDLGVNVSELAGGGAAGGLGAGLVAFAGATLARGIELVMDAVRLTERLQGADLCLTGEGSLDFQSAYGKTAIGVAKRGREAGVPVVIIAGQAGNGASHCLEHGAVAYFDVCPRPMSREESMSQAADNIAQAAENVVRLFSSGRPRV